jgi:hypothetical protein
VRRDVSICISKEKKEKHNVSKQNIAFDKRIEE